MLELPVRYKRTLKALAVYQLLGGVIGFLYAIIIIATSEVLVRPQLITCAIGLVLFTFSAICGGQLLVGKSNLTLSIVNQSLQVFGIWAGPFAFKYAAGINLSFRILIDDMTWRVGLDFPSLTFSYFGEHIGLSLDVVAIALLYKCVRLSEDIKEYKLLSTYSENS